MSHSNAFEKLTDADGNTFTTQVLISQDAPARYTVVVVLAPSNAPMAWCGHGHRSQVAADHCRTWALADYGRLRERAIARRAREAAHVP